MRGTAYHQANLLQADTTHQILGEFKTVKNDIIEALKDHKKENFKPSCVKLESNTSSAQNDVLLTLTQYLEALTKEVQSLEKHKIITVKT